MKVITQSTYTFRIQFACRSVFHFRSFQFVSLSLSSSLSLPFVNPIELLPTIVSRMQINGAILLFVFPYLGAIYHSRHRVFGGCGWILIIVNDKMINIFGIRMLFLQQVIQHTGARAALSFDEL